VLGTQAPVPDGAASAFIFESRPAGTGATWQQYGTALFGAARSMPLASATLPCGVVPAMLEP